MTRSPSSFPAGFAQHALFKKRFGTLYLGSRSEPACLWTRAVGYISPGLLRQELACAEEFAKRHPGGWHFVVDTRGVRLINPINPFWPRRMIRLPGLLSYVAIAPRWIRVLAWIGRPIFRPTHLVRTEAEGLAIVGYS